MKTNRREFLKLTAGAVTAGSLAAIPVESEASEAADYAPGTMVKMYDSTLCIGCQSCVVACYETNFLNRAKNFRVPENERNFIEREDLIPKLSPEDEFSPDYPWLRTDYLDYRLRTVILGYQDEQEKTHFIKRNCMHCKKPGCVSACPVSALQKDPEDGIVTYDENRCIGCRYCQMACPFNVPAFEWHRAIPKISKCDMCRSTINKKDGGENTTACVKACPAAAVIYGKRSDLLQEAKRRINESKAKGDNRYYVDTVLTQASIDAGKEIKEEILGENIYGGTGELFLAGTDFKNLGFPTEKLAGYSYAEKSEKIQHTIYKGMIAPIALFSTLAFVIKKNSKNHHKED